MADTWLMQVIVQCYSADTTSSPLNLDAESRERIFQHHARSVISGFTNTLDEKNASAPYSSPGGERVGILGAGIGGLYSAVILQSLGVPFEIIEADNRIGGRLHTHKFEQGGKYDYFVRSFNLFFIRLHD